MFRHRNIESLSPQEAAGHPDRSAVLSLDAAAPRFVDAEVLALCRSGNRSAKAAEALAAAGVKVRNVAGGMTAWMAAGLPVVRDDGTPGTVA